MKLYGIKACDTCRKALKSLQSAGHDVSFIDVRDTRLTPEKLAQFHKALGDELLNTRSTTWRSLTEAEKSADIIALLTDHPTLMKRPVIEDKTLHLGWKKDVQDALL